MHAYYGVFFRLLPAIGLVSLLAGCSQLTGRKTETQRSGASQQAVGERGAVGGDRQRTSPPVATAKEAAPERAGRERTSLERARAEGKPEEKGFLKDVHFAFDRYELSPESREILQENGRWLKSNPKTKAEIEGHADDRGTVEYNLALGTKRAQEVKEYLSSLGIESLRLSTISYGEELPLCTEHEETCWQKNRRAHFVAVTR
jgi:peptidoglycan-associated lipoprotein